MRDLPNKVRPKYDRAIFLDRDGTINVDTHYPHKVEDLVLIPRVIEGIRLLSDLEAHLIVVSNQAGIPLGIFTQEQMSSFNQGILDHVGKANGRLDAFYFSPFLEAKNLSPRVSLHSTTKPSPGMLLEAAQDYSIDLSKSFIIGDKTSDIVAGQLVNCTTILVLTGKSGKEEDAIPCKPDHIVADLYEAAVLVRKLF
ncbi:MAG: HAD family hydrolase [Chloroflexi bacterium]|nr:HAD family hydrolase [Chloroflexota bacterium]